MKRSLSRMLTVVVTIVMLLSLLSSFAMADAIKSEGYFADVYVDPYGEILNTAYLWTPIVNDLPEGAVDFDFVWEGKAYTFKKGVNAFATYAEIEDHAQANSVEVLQIILPANDITTANSETMNVEMALEIYGVNRNVNPNVSADPSDPTADWIKNPEWTKNGDSSIGQLGVTASVEGIIKLKGVTMRKNFYDTNRPQSNDRCDVWLENIIVETTSDFSSGGYIFNIGGNQRALNSTSASFGETYADEFMLKNCRIESMMNSQKTAQNDNRIFNNASAAKMTIDGLYVDFDNKDDGYKIGHFGYTQTGKQNKTFIFTLKNSNLRNYSTNPDVALTKLMNIEANQKVLPTMEGGVAEVYIDNNILYNLYTNLYTINFYPGAYTYFSVSGNYMINPTDSNRHLIATAGTVSASDNFSDKIVMRDNWFIGLGALQIANASVTTQTVIDVTGSYCAPYTEDYINGTNGTQTPGRTKWDYFYTDFAKTKRTVGATLLGVSFEDQVDSVEIDEENKVVNIKMSQGEVTNPEFTFDMENVTYGLYSDLECTEAATGFYYDQIGLGGLSLYLKVDGLYGSLIYQLRIDKNEEKVTKDFATEFVDPYGKIENTAALFCPNDKDLVSGAKVTASFMGETYEFTYGTNAFSTTDEIASAGVKQVIMGAGNYTDAIWWKDSVEVYGVNYMTNPNIEGSDQRNPAWGRYGETEINGNFVVDAAATPTSEEGTTIYFSGLTLKRYINDAQREISEYKTTVTFENNLYSRTSNSYNREFNMANKNALNSTDLDKKNIDELNFINLRLESTSSISSHRWFSENMAPIVVIDGLYMPDLADSLGYPKASASSDKISFVLKNSYFKNFTCNTNMLVSFSGHDANVASDERDNRDTSLTIQDNIFINCGHETKGADNKVNPVQIFPQAYKTIDIISNEVVSTMNYRYDFVDFATIDYIVNDKDFSDRITFKDNKLIGNSGAIYVNDLTAVDVTDNYAAEYTEDYMFGKQGGRVVGNVTRDSYYLDYDLTVRSADMEMQSNIPGFAVDMVTKQASAVVTGEITPTFNSVNEAAFSVYADSDYTTEITVFNADTLKEGVNKLYLVGEKNGCEMLFDLYIMYYDSIEGAIDAAEMTDIENPYLYNAEIGEAPYGATYYQTWKGNLYKFTIGENAFGSFHELAAVTAAAGITKPNVIIPAGVYTDDIGITGSANVYGEDGKTILKNADLEVRKIRIATVGDSITEGVGSTNYLTGSYPAQLQQQLGSAYEVKNFGIGAARLSDADHTRSYIRMRNGSLYQQSLEYNPDIVIFMLGTNDTYDSRNFMNPESFIARYNWLIDTYKELPTNPKIVMNTVLQRADNSVSNVRVMHNVVPAQKEVAAERNGFVIDINTPMGEILTTEYFPDNLHPNDTGYGIMAGYIKDGLMSYINSPQDVTVSGITFENGQLDVSNCDENATLTIKDCVFNADEALVPFNFNGKGSTEFSVENVRYQDNEKTIYTESAFDIDDLIVYGPTTNIFTDADYTIPADSLTANGSGTYYLKSGYGYYLQMNLTMSTVDKYPLQVAIEKAQDIINGDDYLDNSAASREALSIALNNALTVFNNDQATQPDITTALNELNEAIEGLTVDTSELIRIEGATEEAENKLKVDVDKATSYKLAIELVNAEKVEVFADPDCKVAIAADAELTLSQKTTRVYIRAYTGEESYELITLEIETEIASVEYADEIPAWANTYVQYLNEGGYGILIGDENSNFNPKKEMTRYEIAVVAAKLLGVDASKFASVELEFEDNIANWASNYVKAVVTLGMMSGNDNGGRITFDGQNPTQRQQFARIMAEAIRILENTGKDPVELYNENKAAIDKEYEAKGFADESSVQSWAKPYVRLAVVEYELLSGSPADGKLYINGNSNILRQEISVVLAKYLGCTD